MRQGKVITALKDRREIEAALRALARARTEQEAQLLLQSIASFGSAVLPVLVRHLGTPDPWMVRALGRVAVQIEDRERAADALRRAILSPNSSDRCRIVAMVLLDQFLQQPLEEPLFAALGNPTEVAVRALLGEGSGSDRSVCLDYLSIIHGQLVQEIMYALNRFREAGSDRAAQALQFFALDERELVAESALQALGKIRRPEALRALQVLECCVPSFRKASVERVRRKLLLAGMPDEPRPDPPPGSRVLVSPIDGAGNRLILFLFPQEGSYRVLHIFLDDEVGIRGAYEVTYARGEFPQAQPVGSVYAAPHPWEGIFVLEASWAYARHLLDQAAALNEARGSHLPLEYRFFCGQIWGCSVPEEEPRPLPDFKPGLSERAVSALLGHPYLVSWFVESQAIVRAAHGLAQVDLTRHAGQGLLAMATVSLVQEEFTPEVCLQYARRLWDTAGWLVRAGEDDLAAIAAAGAREMESTQPLGSIFALLLLQKGLLVAAGSLRRGDDRPER